MSHETSTVIAATILAQADVNPLGPWAALIQTSALVAWVCYMIWKDNRDSVKRDTQHKENLEKQDKVDAAIRNITTALMVAVGAMKSSDSAYSEMAAKVKDENLSPK